MERRISNDDLQLAADTAGAVSGVGRAWFLSVGLSLLTVVNYSPEEIGVRRQFAGNSRLDLSVWAEPALIVGYGVHRG